MPNVEFIYDSNCPNVAGARENLARAFARAGLAAKWKEWERSNPATPDYARAFGSPAILINGQDLGGMHGWAGPSCRVYRTGAGCSTGTPPVELIVEALTSAASKSSGAGLRGLKFHLPVIPAIVFALLPNLACPACWPAYAGSLSAFGLGFLVRSEYLLSVTAAFVAITLVGLWYRAKTRHGYRPLCLGALGAATLLMGKFWLESGPLLFAGLLTLMGASVWNAWPPEKKLPLTFNTVTSKL